MTATDDGRTNYSLFDIAKAMRTNECVLADGLRNCCHQLHTVVYVSRCSYYPVHDVFSRQQSQGIRLTDATASMMSFSPLWR